MDIIERLTRLLQCLIHTKLYVFKSIVDELASGGAVTSEALSFAKRYCALIDDSTVPGPTPAARLKNMITDISFNSSLRYFVATQDKQLRIQLGNIPGVPLGWFNHPLIVPLILSMAFIVVYFNKVTLVLEPPSEASRKHNGKVTC